MTYSTLFQIANLIAMLSWITLFLFAKKLWCTKVIFGFSILLLATSYAILLFTSLAELDMQSFNTLQGVKDLFNSDKAVLLGWLHYLAFDLMVGLYILTNGQKYSISRVMVIVSQFFTFMFGPVGLLIYLISRSLKLKNFTFY